MSELKEKYIQFCCDFYNEYAPEDKLWFGRMYDECLQEHNKRNSTMYRWQFPLMILKDQEAKIKELKAQLNNMEQCYIQLKQINNEQAEIIRGHFSARQEMKKCIDAALYDIAQAKDGFYGYSSDGGDVDNLTKNIEKSLRGER